MINSKLVVSISIVLIIGIVAAGYQINSKNPELWQSTDLGTNPDDVTGLTGTSNGQGQGGTGGIGDGTGTSGGQSGTGDNNMKLSPSEAKKIAEKYIKVPGAVAGTPIIIKQGGKPVYDVPILLKGKKVGGIYIDPETGENLGGYGGAP